MDKRQLQLNTSDRMDGGCVLYVMSRDQRVHDNHALLLAQQQALELKLPLAVVFCLLPKTGHRSHEHYRWMLDGLRGVESDLAKFNIPFMMLIGDPLSRLKSLFHHTDPATIYFDMSPLRGPRKLHMQIAQDVQCPVYEVDTHNIVPTWRTSDKQEYAARTIRPKIHKSMPEFIEEPQEIQSHSFAWPGVVRPMKELQPMIDDVLEALPSNGQTIAFASGEVAAKKVLRDFIAKRLRGYGSNRNDPSLEGLSGLSPYLHFGQISSLRAMIEVEKAVSANPKLRADADALIEELVIRKELSDNFCYYNTQYDSLNGAPQWGKATLHKHANDPRNFLYNRTQFDESATHDPVWNAAQNQLRRTGKMHGYMRMYWAKKVLEWTSSPEEAMLVLKYLNDFYSLDGGDPNGYVGILWSVGGLHDRPWFERSIFGTVRYMNDSGLRRKFDVDAYIRQNA